MWIYRDEFDPELDSESDDDPEFDSEPDPEFDSESDPEFDPSEPDPERDPELDDVVVVRVVVVWDAVFISAIVVTGEFTVVAAMGIVVGTAFE